MLDMPFRALVKKMRLNEAFLRLENPGPEDTVASVAHGLFFGKHLGYFARDYCALHYENPFKTLQRGRSRHSWCQKHSGPIISGARGERRTPGSVSQSYTCFAMNWRNLWKQRSPVGDPSGSEPLRASSGRNWGRIARFGIAIIAVVFAVFIARVLFRNPATLPAFFRRPQTLPWLLLFVAVLVVLLLWKLPQWQVSRSKALTDDNRFDRENEARKTLAQIIGGVVVLAGLYSSMQTFDLGRQGQDLTREGQITDRYTKAIEQLGAIQSQASKDGEPLPRLEIRLGGIYALERIARDSERDRGPILEVLTAYVRANSHQESLVPKDGGVRQDIQGILDVVARRREGGYIFQPFQIDLSEAKLHGANRRIRT